MLDKLLSFTLDLNRFDAKTRLGVLRILTEMQRELSRNLATKELSAFNKAKTTKLLKESREIISNYYAMTEARLATTLEEVPEITVKSTIKALEDRLPPSLEASVPSQEVFKALAKDTLVTGTVVSEWWAKQSVDVTFRYNQAVKLGISLGETNQQIIKRVRGVMDIAKRNAAGLVQTSVAAVANEARQETFKQNEDVIKGYKWISALDTRVCEMCLARADKEWTIKGDPIDHGVPFSTPPIHYNDRCILTAVTKRFAELGFPEIKEPKKGQRASTSGPVSSKTTFDDFLKRKGEAWQDEVLGKGRAELWRSDKITLEQLINGEGRPLTVKELKAKYN